MTNLKLKTATAVLTLITGILLISVTEVVKASPDFFIGKVQYSDDHSPVTEGTVRIMTFDNSTRTYNVLETISIDQNGTFKVNRNLILTTDEIRIMAYPNDVDNIEIPFEPLELELQGYKFTGTELYDILIEVNRISSINSNDIGKIITPGSSIKQDAISLEQNYPNPFNPSTMIRFELTESNNVSLIVYDMKGETVAVLANNERLPKGVNQLEFNAGDLPSGIYVYTLTAGNFTENKKMTLLK